MSDEVAPPIAVITESPVPASLVMLVRQVTLGLSFAAALAGFLSKHDIAGAVTWLQTTEGLSQFSAAVFLGTIVLGQLNVLKLRSMLSGLIKNDRVPNDLAKFK